MDKALTNHYDVYDKPDTVRPFTHIKPFKVGTLYSIPIVVKMVSDPVKQALDLLSIHGSIIENVSKVHYLLIPGNGPIIINDEYIEDIKQWCVPVEGSKRVEFKLADGALKFINQYQK